MLHHGQVVGDEQIRQVQLVLQVHQQVNDLRLDRHVERRHRLVADDELWIERERARDTDALALAAGELVWIGVHLRRSQAHPLEQGLDQFVGALAFRQAVHFQGLADDAPG